MVKKFDKKNATTYNVVHRAHDDARFFDDNASNVLVPTAQSQKNKVSSTSGKKVFSTHELEAKLRDQVRENEGLAAQYGITFDDSKYDYMQHLKPIGNSDGVFISAKDRDQQRRQEKLDLEQLLKDQLPSTEKRKVTKDLNQSIPDELKGFNPNMDPRLREVLEALEDEAYIEEVKHKKNNVDVDDDEEYDDDIFADLLRSGQAEEDEYDYYDEDEDYGDDYDEWDLDNYEDEYDAKYDEHPEEILGQEGVNEDWQRDFMKFKKESKNKENTWDSDDEFDEESEAGEDKEEEEDEDEGDNVGELPDMKSKFSKSNTKLRKKKGAMTDTSSFSMSSSALFRSEGLSLLDDRYEQLNKKYNRDDTKERDQKPFDMGTERNDFAGLVDDFLENYELESGGRKLTKKDTERAKLQEAASSVSRGKAGRKLDSSFAGMKIN
ncbi:LTV1 [Candida margitis]|uniref:LTV1 n=1 Tax=Candida margitis TaxID=1775924 RepID=UPI0022277641|nr:LTV1 [Candida margitis]KAI5963929.1 LTV1 [Candida margitis]